MPISFEIEMQSIEILIQCYDHMTHNIHSVFKSKFASPKTKTSGLLFIQLIEIIKKHETR